MADVTTRRQGEMVQTLFRILSDEPEGLQAKDAIARVESAMELTPFELSTFPKNPDIVRFPKLLRFATINAVKAGWLRKKAGIWTLTDEGRAALEAFPDPEALFAESRRLYKDWKGQPARRRSGYHRRWNRLRRGRPDRRHDPRRVGGGGATSDPRISRGGQSVCPSRPGWEAARGDGLPRRVDRAKGPRRRP